jgi:arylsulfatase A-like enzyme
MDARPEPRGAGAPSAFVLAAALLPPLVLAKAAHWERPAVYWRDVLVAAHADVAFALGFGLVAWALLRPARSRPRLARRLGLGLTALGAFAALYAAVSMHVFAYLRSPLTYPLLYLAGDARSMSSSIGSFVTPTAVLGLIAAAGGYLAGVRLLARAAAPAGRARLALGAAAVAAAAAWAFVGHGVAAGRWSDRPDLLIARSPHWEFLASLAELRGSAVPPLGESFPDEHLDDFEPGAATRPVALHPSGARPRNVLLVVLESTGARYLGLYGSPYKTTPNLDAEAAHALVFDRFYAHVGMTANSLAALSLSIYPYMTWREYTQDHPDFPGETLADVLGDCGYRTAFLTSGFLDYVGQDRFLHDRGFDQVLDWDDLAGDGESINSWGGSEAVLVDRTLAWIDRERHRPFYAVVWTQQSHHPYDPLPGQPTIDFFAGRELPPDDYDLGRYLNTLAEVDRQIGRLFAGLRERDLDRDTLVVVTGDHGEAFGDPHPTWGHGFRLYDEGVRVPLMIWSPSLFPRGRRVGTLGGHVDLSPTIADLVGVPAPASWQGRSLFDAQRPPRAYFYAANDDYLLGVREGDWKYIYNATRGRDELYDLARDPDERVNLAAQHPERCRTLRRRLAAWKHAAAERLARAREGTPAGATRRADVAP